MTSLPIDFGNAKKIQDIDFCIAQHVEKTIMNHIIIPIVGS
jgi:hypothetical protein